jgi:hypothetical protein
MQRRVLYLGDDHLGAAAAYLAGVMEHFGLPYDHVPSLESPPGPLVDRGHRLYVVSDYPAARFRPGQMDQIARHVRAGAGLLMVGGWESFFGQAGQYHRSPLAEALPVVMALADDRVNCAQPCLIRPSADHPILAGLPWDRPPGIGGFNAFQARPGAETILHCVQFQVRRDGQGYCFTPERESPLLVLGACQRGRTAALACDLAPHWVGGLVDWGAGRVVEEVAGGQIEVGDAYARFCGNLLHWTGRWEE